MSAPAPPATKPQYYIADGVHRAVAARENGLLLLPARLVVQGQADRLIYTLHGQLWHNLLARCASKGEANPCLRSGLVK